MCILYAVPPFVPRQVLNSGRNGRLFGSKVLVVRQRRQRQSVEWRRQQRLQRRSFCSLLPCCSVRCTSSSVGHRARLCYWDRKFLISSSKSSVVKPSLVERRLFRQTKSLCLLSSSSTPSSFDHNCLKFSQQQNLALYYNKCQNVSHFLLKVHWKIHKVSHRICF